MADVENIFDENVLFSSIFFFFLEKNLHMGLKIMDNMDIIGLQ